MECVKVVIIVIIECVLRPLAADRFEPKPSSGDHVRTARNSEQWRPCADCRMGRMITVSTGRNDRDNCGLQVEVDGCTKSKLKLTIRDAADGGIVYIQGPSTTCNQYTQPDVSQHTFDVRACAVTWSEIFRVIVQRHPLYQTGEDKRFPVTCIPDTSDLQVGNRVINVIDKTDEIGITKTVRPTATMSLYRNGVDINGKEVKLTDQITMTIRLDEDHSDDFDIQAIDCYGDDIQIINDGCPVDEALFPKFTSIQQGKLQATFGVFRPTKLNGGTIKIAFSCSLQVYLGHQIPTACDDNRELNAIHKRKLQADSGKVDEIIVGNSLLINTVDVSTERISTRSKESCDYTSAFAVVVVLLVVSSLLTVVLCICMQRKLKAKGRHIKQLKNDMKARDLYSRQMLIDMDSYMDSCDTVYSARNCRSDRYYD